MKLYCPYCHKQIGVYKNRYLSLTIAKRSDKSTVQCPVCAAWVRHKVVDDNRVDMILVKSPKNFPDMKEIMKDFHKRLEEGAKIPIEVPKWGKSIPEMISDAAEDISDAVDNNAIRTLYSTPEGDSNCHCGYPLLGKDTIGGFTCEHCHKLIGPGHPLFEKYKEFEI